MWRALALAAVLAAGCYDPQFADGLPCSAGYQCPEGQTCQAGPDICVREGPSQQPFAQLSAGAHTCGIDDLERLFCWGDNRDGELGVGDTLPRGRPTRVGVDSGWEAVAVGDSFTLGLRTDHTLWGWGEGDYFEDGMTSMVPRPLGVSNVTQMITGNGIWCIVDDATTATCFERGTPVAITPPDGWDTISASGSELDSPTLCGLRGSELWCWGDNTYGQTGTALVTDPVLTPTQIGTERAWIAVAVGADHTCAIDDDKALWCWGRNVFGQVAQTNLGDTFTVPTRVTTDFPVSRVAGAWNTTCALEDEVLGAAGLCFGAGERGQVGDGLADPVNPRQRVISVTPFGAISVGIDHTCGIDPGNLGWCWGSDDGGQLGDGQIGHDLVPTLLDDHRVWEQISVGERHSCAIDNERKAACWGHNGHGQLGDDADLRRIVPSSVVDVLGTGWETISVGLDHTCALRPDHTLWCWGSAGRGELGFGLGGDDLLTPAQVGEKTYEEVVAVEGGGCAISDGDMYCWGGVRGANPTQLTTQGNWSSLARGVHGQVCARHAGAIECWRLSDSDAPVALTLTVSWDTIAVGSSHQCGLSGSMLTCIGSDLSGELGDGPTPGTGQVAPIWDSGFSAVAAGDQFTCGISDGTLVCWGNNVFGQVGDATRLNQPAPIDVAEGRQWRTVSASGGSACAIDTEEENIYCWGVNNAGGGGWDVPAAVVVPE